MLQYDLSRTRLASAEEPRPVPTEGELLALTVSLLLLDGCACADLAWRSLELTFINRDRVAVFIERRLQPLLRDFVNPFDIRGRLDELVGLRIQGSDWTEDRG